MGGEAGDGDAGTVRDQRRRRRIAIAAIALSVATFGFVAFASSAGSVHPVVQGDGGWRFEARRDDPSTRDPTDQPRAEASEEQPEPGVAGDVAAGFGQFVVLAAGAGLLALLVRRTVRFVSRVRLAPRLDTDGWEAVPADARDELDAAAEAGLHRMRDGGPTRDVIIDCWVALEEAAGRAGIERAPSETASELTVRVLGGMAVPEPAVRRLLELYRDARYSTHELAEPARADAVAALDEIRRSLGIAASR
jgi:hypothetical protein